MLRMFKYMFLIAVAVFVCYHYRPVQTKKVGHTLYDKTSRAANELAK